MEFRRKLSPGDSIPAKVSRVVPGRLFYIETSAPKEVIACTPDALSLQQSDGSMRRYRGESFAEIGVKVGTDVKVTVDSFSKKRVVLEQPKGSFLSRVKGFNFGLG